MNPTGSQRIRNTASQTNAVNNDIQTNTPTSGRKTVREPVLYFESGAPKNNPEVFQNESSINREVTERRVPIQQQRDDIVDVENRDFAEGNGVELVGNGVELAGNNVELAGDGVELAGNGVLQAGPERADDDSLRGQYDVPEDAVGPHSGLQLMKYSGINK